MPSTALLRTLLLAAMLLAFNVILPAEDFPHWRGPQRNDHVREDSGYAAKAWPLGKPAWKQHAGEGSTSPIVVGDRVYVMGWGENRDHLHCLSAATGERLWTQSYESPRYARYAVGDEGLYSGVTSTPEYDAATHLLYTLSSNGELRCWRTDKQGELAWRKNLYDEYAMPARPRVLRSGKRDYGYTTSPLVYKDWLLVEVGGKQGTVMALDKATGAEVWSSEHRDLAGHTGSIVIVEVENVPCAAILTLKELVVMRLDDAHRGKTVANFPWETEWANNIQTPTVVPGGLLIGAYHTHHAIARIKLSLTGASRVWQADYASYTGSPIVHGDHLYFAGKQLHCLDVASGKLVWQGGEYEDGASLLLTKDQRLIALGSNGALALVDSAALSPTAYRELARMDKVLAATAWPHLALADGRLYAKDRLGELKCWNLAGSK